MEAAGDLSARAIPQGSQESVIDLGALLRTLWQGKWLIALVVAIAVLLGGYYAYKAAVPLYRATAVVILETKQESIVDIQSVLGGMSGDTSEINSEVEVFKSRTLMGKVVDELNLMSDPEFNSALKTPSSLSRLKSAIKSVIGLASPGEVATPDYTKDATITALLNHTTIRNVPQSLVFQVTVETEEPQKSALIADTVTQLYVRDQVDVKLEATAQAKTWLSGRVTELQKQLEAAEAAVSSFNSSTNLISVEALQLLDRQAKDLRERIGATEMSLTQSQATLDNLTSAQTRAAQAIAADLPLSEGLSGSDPVNTAAAQAFDNRFAQVVNRAEVEVTRLTQQLSALRASESTLQSQINSQNADLIKLQQLTREAEATRLLYEYFLTRFKETSAQEGIQQPDSRILSNAVVPGNAASPRKSLILMMSAILGAMIGAALVLFREASKSGFRTAPDLESATGYAVLGQIPIIPSRNRQNTLAYLIEKPDSAAAESIRNLRTSLLLSNVDSPPQVIVSTSSIPGEGKTTTSLALAQNMGDMGRRVLLIDGDIRRRMLKEYFDDLPEHGIVSVISGEKTLDEAIYHNHLLKADMLVGEKTPVNAADLFSSDRFQTLITELRGRYDTIIIDTPPVLIVPDARIIAQSADAVLFSVKWDSTPRELVEEGLGMFRTGRIRIGGIVLTQIDGRKMQAYGGKYGTSAAYGAKYYTS
ncbi:MAG: polysaccharide biosynthesis tyrosine autokinase [Alphaproteobacteria bacterium]|nr:polysaccharide biosynthesis tyrosine autokinase [Alphaproteobacteria bacterium]